MNYSRLECINKYNEIYHYLLNNNNMPERLKYNDKAKYKTIQKKRTAFRKQVRDNNVMHFEKMHFAKIILFR